MKAPFIVLLVRLLILVVWSFVAYIYRLAIYAGNGFNPRIITIIAIASAACLFTFIISFVHKRCSLWILATFCTVIPLVFWLGFDTSGVVHGALWEWLMVFPVQMGFPVLLSYLLITSKKVRRFYSFNDPEHFQSLEKKEITAKEVLTPILGLFVMLPLGALLSAFPTSLMFANVLRGMSRGVAFVLMLVSIIILLFVVIEAIRLIWRGKIWLTVVLGLCLGFFYALLAVTSPIALNVAK